MQGRTVVALSDHVEKIDRPVERIERRPLETTDSGLVIGAMFEDEIARGEEGSHYDAKYMRPLDGCQVIDFSTLLPGPLATLLLAEAGAEVVSIVRPGAEDM